MRGSVIYFERERGVAARQAWLGRGRAPGGCSGGTLLGKIPARGAVPRGNPQLPEVCSLPISGTEGKRSPRRRGREEGAVHAVSPSSRALLKGLTRPLPSFPCESLPSLTLKGHQRWA